MANAKKCDRCGAFFEPYIEVAHNDKKYFKRIVVSDMDMQGNQRKELVQPFEHTFELCEECLASFAGWIKPGLDDQSDDQLDELEEQPDEIDDDEDTDW